MGRSCVLAFALLLALGGVAEAAMVRVQGTVWADRDRDGLVSVGDAPVPRSIVGWEHAQMVRADDDGRFAMEVDEPGGILWVRVPDGYRPGAAWAAVPLPERPGAPVEVDLLLTPGDGVTPLRFVVAADSHIRADGTPWDEGDLAAVLARALALDPPPAFFTILGDITQDSERVEMEAAHRVVEAAGVPFVSVPGNHDWYDGGEAYHALFGPDTYSFDAGGVHIIVWNTTLPPEELAAFLALDLQFRDPQQLVIGFGHHPPNAAAVAVLEDAGVETLFSGHWHANRVIEHGAGGLLEYDTQCLIMGGIDFSPAGFRVVTLVDGALQIEHHTVVERPVLGLSGADACTDGRELRAMAEIDGSAVRVSARIDGGAEVPLRWRGGWLHAGAPPDRLGAGAHAIELEAVTARGAIHRASGVLRVCEAVASSSASSSSGLDVRWQAGLDGHAMQGAPVLADGLVFVTAADLDDGRGGGIAAFDAATGARRWQHTTGEPVRNAVAAAEGIVVAATTRGTILALDVSDGALRWSYDLAAGLDPKSTALFASPAIADGTVYVGVQRRFVALALATGAVRWAIDPIGRNGAWMGPFAAAAASGGLVVATFERDRAGVIAYDTATGVERWRFTGDAAIAVNATPLIAGDAVYLAGASTEVACLDLATGALRWTTRLHADGFDWGYATAGTLALAGATLVVPTLYGAVVALDAATGAERWRFAGSGESVIHPTHYRARTPAFAGGVAIVRHPGGRTVWAGAADGWLYGLDLASGALGERRDLHAPILGGVTADGDDLYVASYDGTLHALRAHRGGGGLARSLLSLVIGAAIGLAVAALVGRLLRVGRATVV